ncbi:MAG: hypothetical protein KBF03_02605 [Proteiniclasticum sp.]|nr:hypothetical protein [Proteiniclasticum sp.]
MIVHIMSLPPVGVFFILPRFEMLIGPNNGVLLRKGTTCIIQSGRDFCFDISEN